MTQVEQGLRHRLSITTGNESRRKAFLIKLNSRFGFLALRSEIGQERFKNVDAALSTNLRDEEIPMLDGIFQIARRVDVERQIEIVAQRLDRSWISHFNSERENVCGATATMLILRAETTTLDRDATFTVDKSSKISKIFVSHTKNGITKSYQKLGPHQQKSANSANTRPSMTRATPSQTFARRKCVESIYGPRKG